jgi:acetolactate synthase-1/2/3 large subunit
MTAHLTGAQLLVKSLAAHGTKLVSCVAGESYLAVLDALLDHSDIKVITCRQEGGAAFMAESWGKLHGTPGICFVTRGPGVCNASIGVHTAMQDSSPMILFMGQVGACRQRPRSVSGNRRTAGIRRIGEMGHGN